jgi:hypothetical protein
VCIEQKKNKIAELKEKLKQAEEKLGLELGGGGEVKASIRLSLR